MSTGDWLLVAYQLQDYPAIEVTSRFAGRHRQVAQIDSEHFGGLRKIITIEITVAELPHISRTVSLVVHDVVIRFPPIPEYGRSEMRLRVIEKFVHNLDDLARSINSGEPIASIPVLPLSVFCSHLGLLDLP